MEPATVVPPPEVLASVAPEAPVVPPAPSMGIVPAAPLTAVLTPPPPTQVVPPIVAPFEAPPPGAPPIMPAMVPPPVKPEVAPPRIEASPIMSPVADRIAKPRLFGAMTEPEYGADTIAGRKRSRRTSYNLKAQRVFREAALSLVGLNERLVMQFTPDAVTQVTKAGGRRPRKRKNRSDGGPVGKRIPQYVRGGGHFGVSTDAIRSADSFGVSSYVIPPQFAAHSLVQRRVDSHPPGELTFGKWRRCALHIAIAFHIWYEKRGHELRSQ